MAFTPRAWIGRQVEHPGRIKLTPTGVDTEYDVTRSEGIITADGDMLSPENLNDLETRISNQFDITAEYSNSPWTPTLHGYSTPGSPVFTVSGNVLYRLGPNLAYVKCTLTLSSVGGMTGAIVLGGLPLSAAPYAMLATTVCDYLSLPSGSLLLGARAVGTSANVLISNASGWANLDASYLTNTSVIGLAGWLAIA